MADEDLSEQLAAAIADRSRINWEDSDALRAADPELAQSLRLISAIGEARRAGVAAEQARDARPLSLIALLAAAVTILAGYKLALAVLGISVGVWDGTAEAPLQWPLAVDVLLFGCAGVLLVAGGTRDRRLQALGALFLIIASALSGPLISKTRGVLWEPLIWPALHLRTDAFLAMAFWIFVWLFPTETPQPRARRLARVFIGATAGLGVTLFAGNVVLDSTLWSASAAARALLEPLARAEETLYWPLVLGLAGPAIPFLWWKSRADTTMDRRRVTFFVVSLVLGILPILAAVMLAPVVPALQDPAWRVPIGFALYAALAWIVPSTAYAVAVDHLMDLHLVVRTTIRYALARYSVWSASLLPLLYLGVDVYRHRNLTFGDYLTLTHPFALLTMSVLSFVVLTFRYELLRRVDRMFHRDVTDYTESLARLERGLRTSRTIRDISSVLKREIERAVRPTSVAVLLVDEARGQLVSLESAVPPLRRGSALLDLLRSIRTEIQMSYRADGAVAGLLPPGDRRWLADTGLVLFSPLVGSGGALLGIVGIGDGSNGLPYTPRDCMLITAMSGQAALRLENSLLREQASHGPAVGLEAGGVATADWENEPAARCPECASMWEPARRHCSCGAATVEAALPLTVKGKFRVERFLGAGGTGVVYLAVDLALDRKVAIKTLPAIRLEHASRLHREARAMATVQHPNLAMIYGAEQWRGTPLLIFEYLEGGTLLDSIRRGPIPLEEIIDLGTLLADALDRVHASGVLHRDIKPSNIGYTLDGVPKLLDFGLAAILDRSRAAGTAPAVLPADAGLLAELAWGAHPSASLTITQQLVGTPLYLSPEALAGQAAAPSFDLWSLSLVLYEALVGRHPLADQPVIDVIRGIQRGALPDVRDFQPDCPALFAAFLRDALSPVAARRPATAGDLRTRLRWLRGQLFPQAS